MTHRNEQPTAPAASNAARHQGREIQDTGLASAG